MRKTGYLGEGGYLMRNNLYGMTVERTNVYQVHELRVKGWQMAQGQSIEDFFGVKKGQKVILGYQNGNPVVAGGQKNYIENVFEMGDGKLGIKVRETVPFGTGTKVDPVKGLVHGVTDNEWERIKEGMNRYYQAIGNDGYIPDEVEALQVWHYGQSKTEGPRAVLETVSDTFRRLQESGELDQVSDYVPPRCAHIKLPRAGTRELLRLHAPSVVQPVDTH